jgi:hypothetical protein
LWAQQELSHGASVGGAMRLQIAQDEAEYRARCQGCGRFAETTPGRPNECTNLTRATRIWGGRLERVEEVIGTTRFGEDRHTFRRIGEPVVQRVFALRPATPLGTEGGAVFLESREIHGPFSYGGSSRSNFFSVARPRESSDSKAPSLMPSSAAAYA